MGEYHSALVQMCDNKWTQLEQNTEFVEFAEGEELEEQSDVDENEE